MLGLCFRLLADPKNSDSVVNTAAATVRQVPPSPQRIRRHALCRRRRDCCLSGSLPFKGHWHAGSQNMFTNAKVQVQSVRAMKQQEAVKHRTVSAGHVQAVALVFEHVTTVAPTRSSEPDPPGAQPPLSPRHSGLLAEHGPANAALKLLDDLCMMATGALPRSVHAPETLTLASGSPPLRPAGGARPWPCGLDAAGLVRHTVCLL